MASVTLGLYKISVVVSPEYVVIIAVSELFAALGVVFWYLKVVHSFYKEFWQAIAPNETKQPMS